MADNNDQKIKDKFFCGEIKIDLDAMKQKRENWSPMPQFTDFGEDLIREEVMSHSNDALLEHYSDYIRVHGAVVLQGDDLKAAAQEMINAAADDEKNDILERIISQRIDYDVQKAVQENFVKIQNDVREIIRKECEVSQEISPHPSKPVKDSTAVDPYAEPAL